MASKALTYVGPIPRGRPSSYTDELAQEICERLWEGESLTRICSDDDMPGLRTIYRWLDEHADFQRDYERARVRQADTFAEQIQDVAFNLAILPEHKRIMVDSIKWRAARQNWRAWGDKVTHEHAHTVHPVATEEQLPDGIKWLARQLPGGGEPRPEPMDSKVGEG